MQNYPIRHIAVTGANSSIGMAVIEECIRRGIEVTAIFRFSSVTAIRVPNHVLIHKVNCDLAGLHNIKLPGVQCDAFLHLAWWKSKNTERNVLAPQVENIRYALDAVDLAQRLGCHTFMGAGSQAEYGQKAENLTESMRETPSTAYGIAKLCTGQMTRLSCQNKGIRHLWPRILSTYGPWSPYQTVLYYEIRELLSGREPQLSGGEQIWDFIYLRDTAKAILALLCSGHDGEIYLIGSGKARQLKEFFCETRDAVDPALPLALGVLPYASETVMHLGCSIEKIQRDTDWQPQTSFAQGIRETIDWVREGIK